MDLGVRQCVDLGRGALGFTWDCHERAATKPFQWAIASSIGASARATRMALAMITPAVACSLITRQAPSASTADCNIIRSAVEIAPNPPATSLMRCWLASSCWLAASHRPAIDPAIPSANSASALRWPASPILARAFAESATSRDGPRERASVSSVSESRTTAPHTASRTRK